jgi:hypothetical protein
VNTVFNAGNKKAVKRSGLREIKDFCRFFSQYPAKVVFIAVLNHLKLLPPFLKKRVSGKSWPIRQADDGFISQNDSIESGVI